MVFALIDSRAVFHVTITCVKNLSPDFALYTICSDIDILVLEGIKEAEWKKKLADLVSSQCHDNTNLIPVGSAPFPLR